LISKYPKYIELIGVAGVGKTTVAKILIDESHNVGVSLKMREVINRNLWLRLKIFYHILLTLLLVPDIVLLYIVFIRKNFKKTPHVKKIRFNLVNRLIVDYAVIRYYLKNSNDNILNDEGIIGKLVSLSIISKISITKVMHLIKKLFPKNSILIFVKSHPLEALKRERIRDINLPFFDNMEHKLKEKFFYEATANYDQILKLKNFKPDIKKISIYNQGNYNELIDEVKILAKKFIT